MRPVLAVALSREGEPVPLLQVRAELLKYVPGKRGVVVYEVAFAEVKREPQKVFGKIYRKDRGQSMFNTLRALWQASLPAQAGCFALPEPLAYVAELGMVLQSAAAGQALASLSCAEDLFVAMQHTARGLAALHRLPVQTGEAKTFEDHVRKYCHPGLEILAETHPEIAPLLLELLAMMRAEINLRAIALCPVHGDLNLAQIFITPERAVFIDFDGFCRSHAGLDVGNFLVTLAERFGEKSRELRHAFLEAYLAAQSKPELPALRVYQAFAYVRRAVISLRAPNEAERNARALQLLRAALALLQTQAQ